VILKARSLKNELSELHCRSNIASENEVLTRVKLITKTMSQLAVDVINSIELLKPTLFVPRIE